MTQEEIVASLPAHLRPFVQLQDYDQYTPRDQAVWRFIMRQLTLRLRDTAHPVYLEEFAAAMCFQRGGADSLRKAIAAGTVCTARYDSGVQVSGQFVEVLCDAVGKAVYLQTKGPTQLAWRDTEIYGHGTAAHAEGFGSPVGKLKNFSRCLSEYSVDELKAHHIQIGEPVVLEFLSGITVRGRLQHVLRQDHRNLLLSFHDCTVTDLQGRVLFDPAWGQYDMAVGGAIDSVYGGTADREKYQLYKAVPATATVRPTRDAVLQGLYRRVAALAGGAEAVELADGLDAYPDEWLLRVELLESSAAGDEALRQRALADLQRIAAAREDLREVIGLALEVFA